MNTKQIRDRVFIAHRYLGLAIGLLAVPIGLTGSLLILHDLWHDLTTKVTPLTARLPIETIIAKAQTIYPNLPLKSIDLPASPTGAMTVFLGDYTIAIDPYTGNIIGQPATEHYTTLLYDIHIKLLGGDWGVYLVGIVGLLATVLSITGIVLWPGWRKLSTGFKIKWDAKTKRLNFDLHKVVGIISAVFLALAMGTGFMWNFSSLTNPVVYAMTFSAQPPETKDTVSTVTADGKSIAFTETLLQNAIAALPTGTTRMIAFPETPDGVFNVRKELPDNVWVSAYLDRYSGRVIKVDSPHQSLGEKILQAFPLVHFGTFAGLASRLLYIFVGLSPTILLVTGFIMWQNRRRVVKSKSRGAAVES
jgi:uncharacterized iron-regulated membrane protein